MESIFGLFILCLIIWMLFIRGALFKLILAIFAFIGMRSYLWANFLGSHAVFMDIVGFTVSWAAFIPAIIIILAMATTSVSK